MSGFSPVANAMVNGMFLFGIARPLGSLTHTELFPALEHGDNGRRLVAILNSGHLNQTQKLTEILKLLVQDQMDHDAQTSLLGRLGKPVGGFGPDSFKVYFIGKLIRADFTGCETESALKKAMATRLKSIAESGTPAQPLCQAVLAFQNSSNAASDFMSLGTEPVPAPFRVVAPAAWNAGTTAPAA